MNIKSLGFQPGDCRPPLGPLPGPNICIFIPFIYMHLLFVFIDRVVSVVLQRIFMLYDWSLWFCGRCL
jgi:hypothetical protein